ncbi:MAG: DUF3343 domain-containing protein [Eubacteriales bacterium]|nr:DUF3343 domain-containing protein [Eubacteriales bacterium]
MKRYIATFHTHFAAMATFRAMCGAGIAAELCPVPRALSADCGTCVHYDAPDTCEKLLHADFDRVVLVGNDGGYEMLAKNDAP